MELDSAPTKHCLRRQVREQLNFDDILHLLASKNKNAHEALVVVESHVKRTKNRSVELSELGLVLSGTLQQVCKRHHPLSGFLCSSFPKDQNRCSVVEM
jgi:hypothetical protein